MPLIDQAPGIPIGDGVTSVGHLVTPSRIQFSRLPSEGGGTVSIDLDRCIGNVNGELTVGFQNFSQSSRNIRLPYAFGQDLGILEAECRRSDGSWVKSRINLFEYMRMFKGNLEVVYRSTESAIYGNLNKIFSGAPVGPAFAPGTQMLLDSNSPYNEDGRHWNANHQYWEDKLGYHIWVGEVDK